MTFKFLKEMKGTTSHHDKHASQVKDTLKENRGSAAMSLGVGGKIGRQLVLRSTLLVITVERFFGV
jgi:hypothetical protein